MDVIDWNSLRENCAGDDGLVNEILELFRKEGPALLVDVQRAVAARDGQSIKRTAHRLKGALVSLAAQPATAVAKELEHAGAQNELARVADLQIQLDAEMARLLGALSARAA